MREILFRGIRVDGGGWVEGFYFEKEVDMKDEEVEVESLIYTKEQKKYEVFYESVGQATGLKDKAGKIIFEGDVLLKWDGDTGEVVFKDGCFNVKGFYSGDQDCPTMAFSENAPFKIVGNIHDTDNSEDI